MIIGLGWSYLNGLLKWFGVLLVNCVLMFLIDICVYFCLFVVFYCIGFGERVV